MVFIFTRLKYHNRFVLVNFDANLAPAEAFPDIFYMCAAPLA